MERRFSCRAEIDVPVVTIVDGFRHEGRTLDLSSSGMVFERPKSLLYRELIGLCPVEVALHPGQKPLRAKARVVWTDRRLSAVRFVTMNDADKLTIAEYMDMRSRRGQPLH